MPYQSFVLCAAVTKRAKIEATPTRKTPARGAKRGAKEDAVVAAAAVDNNQGGGDGAPSPNKAVDGVVDDVPPAIPPALPPVEETMNDGEDVAKPTADGEEGTAGADKSGEGSSLVDPLTSSGKDFRGGQESWNAMLYQLILFKTKNGDLNISADDPSNRALFNWIQTQRRHYELYMDNKTSSTFLNADRIAVLDAIDFQWNIRGESFWQKHFDALVAYKREYGDARVPRHYSKNSKLGEWVTDQRRQFKAKSEGKPTMLTDERKAQLDELGFIWKVRDRADWNDRYEQLLEFKKENGHCIVPQHYSRNRALGKWVAKQREQYRFFREGRHSFLTEERIDLLKSINFTWQIKGRNKRDLNAPMTISKPPPVAAAAAKTAAAKTDEAILQDAAEKTTAAKKSPVTTVAAAAAAAVTAATPTADAVPVGKVESKGPGPAQAPAGTTAPVPSLPRLSTQISAGMAAGMTPADAMNPVNALQQQLLLQQQRNMAMGGMAGMGIGAGAAANFNFASAMAAGAVPGRHFGTGFGSSQLAQIAAMNQQQQNDKDHNQFQQTMDI